MNLVRLTAAVLALGLFCHFPAQAEGSYFNGNQYLNLPENERNLLVQGLWDGWDQGASIFENAWSDEGRTFVNRMRTCVAKLSSSQLRALFDAHYKAHPEAAVYAAASTFQVAMQQGCP